MAIICSKYLSTRDFHYSEATKCFIAEASELPYKEASRVYDDAADEGFILISHKTGAEVVFALDGTDMCDDDVAGWRFKAIAERVGGRWKPCQKPFTVLIIND